MENMRSFDARGLANTAWAFGKLRYVPDPALPALLSSHAAAKINDFVAQNLSNLAWAMVYMHHKDDALLALMSQRVRGLTSTVICCLALQWADVWGLSLGIVMVSCAGDMCMVTAC